MRSLGKLMAHAGAVALAAGQASPIVRTPGAAIAGGIMHVANPHLPQFRFEFHPGVRKVFLIRKGILVGGKEVGTSIADMIVDASTARYIIGSWCIGYRQAEADRARLDASAGDVGETKGAA